MSVVLTFRAIAKSGPPWILVFGEDDPSVAAAIGIDLGSPLVDFGVAVDVQSVRSTMSSTWKPAAGLKTGTVLSWRDYVTLRAKTSLPWVTAGKLYSGTRLPYRQMAGVDPVSWATPWAKAVPAPLRTSLPWVKGATVSTTAQEPWRQGVWVTSPPQDLPWQSGVPIRRRVSATSQEAVRQAHYSEGRYSDGTRVVRRLREPWKDARALYSYGGPRLVPGIPVVPGDVCYLPDTELVFRDLAIPGNTALVFRCAFRPGPLPGIVVPIQRVYLVINELLLKKVVGNVTLRCTNLSMSLDNQSWSWNFSATLGIDDFVHFPATAGAVELEAWVNGVNYRLRASRVVRRRAYGKESVEISGRGRIDELDAPTSPILAFGNTSLMSAAQLMAQVLTFNGVSIGWGVDFRLEDWDIDPDAWKMTGTYIEGLQKIAQAAGGYLQPHRTDKTVIVLPKYPVAPWNWSGVAGFIDLPPGPVSTEDIEFENKPAYNRVYVTGQGQGVISNIKVAGTAGDRVAPTVVDPLVTRLIAGRQRGLSILGDTGEKAMVTLKLPVLAETGIIQPGNFVRYYDSSVYRIGLVRRVSVAATLSDLWQTIGVETHV